MQHNVMTEMKNEGVGRRVPAWRRWIPLLLLLLGLVAVFALGLPRYLSFEQFGPHHAWLVTEVSTYPVQATILFFALYVATTSLSVPGAAILTIAGGYLFGTLWGSAVVLLAATAGASLVFLAARTALGDLL